MKINKLKQGKVSLMKKQRENALKHKEFTEQKRKEIQAMKRKEKKTGLRVTKLETECRHHKLNLEKRKKICDKLLEKLKQTESHLMKVLQMRKKMIAWSTQNQLLQNKGIIIKRQAQYMMMHSLRRVTKFLQ